MATRVYDAIDKTIDGLKLEEFNNAAEQLAESFDSEYSYSKGRYVIYNNAIYQKITEPTALNKLTQPYDLQITYGNSYSEYGITWVINSDGSIVIDGTAEDDCAILLESKYFEEGEYYTLSGCPPGGSTSTYYLAIVFNNYAPIEDTGSGETFIMNEEQARIYCIIKSGTTLNNKVFYPQLELGQTKSSYSQPNKLNEEFIPSHWRLIKHL